MVMEYTVMLMVPSTKESGKMISKKAMAEKSGQTRVASRECIKTARSMDLESLSGLMEQVMRVTGNQTKCMEREFSNGLMEESTRVNTKMIRNMAMVSLLGQMGEDLKACGRMENS